MNKKQSFNSGAKMGIRLSEDIVKRDAAAVEQLNKLAKQLPGKFVEIQEVISSLSSSVEKIEVEKVFGIIRTKGVEDLEYEEQIILLKVLQQIASYSEPNLSQRNFMRRLSGAMDINIDDIMYNSYADIALVDEIDSRSVHRLMYQVVKEYLYLGNNSHQYDGDYEFILSHFSRDVKKDETETLITFKVSLFGPEILYEQYGDVSFERNEIEEDIDKIHTTIKDIKYTASLSLLRFGLIYFDMASTIGNHREEEHLFTEYLNKRSKETDKAYQDFIEKHENDHSICLEFNDILTQINDSFITNKAVVNIIRGIKNSDDVNLQEFTFGVQDRVGTLLFIFTPNDVFVFGEDEIIYLDYKYVTHIEQNYEGLTITYCMANNCKTEPASKMLPGTILAKCNGFDFQMTREIRLFFERVIDGNGYMTTDSDTVIRTIIEDHLKSSNAIVSNYATTILVKDIKTEKDNKRLSRALDSFASKVRREDAVALVDTTLFGNGKDGMLFAVDGIAFKSIFDNVFLKYKEIEKMEISAKGKELRFVGSFDNVKKKNDLPLITNTYYDLNELKAFIEEILFHA